MTEFRHKPIEDAEQNFRELFKQVEFLLADTDHSTIASIGVNLIMDEIMRMGRDQETRIVDLETVDASIDGLAQALKEAVRECVRRDREMMS